MKFLLLSFFILLFFPVPAYAANPGDIVINEIAWMGTTGSYHQEWLELYNNSDSAINIEGWILRATDETPSITLGGSIPTFGFFLLEKSSSAAPLVSPADQVYTGSLMVNSGEHMELIDKSGNVIDDVNAFGSWFAGDNAAKQTMERKNPKLPGSDPVNWGNSAGPDGTPKSQNSVVATSDPPIPADASPQITADNDPLIADVGVSENQLAISGNQLNQSNSATTTQSPNETPQVPVYPLNIFINELMPYPLGPDELEEWIEITNENNEPADISLWQIKDTLGATYLYTLPTDTTIAPRGFLVLSRPTTKITMNNDNDGIQLIRPNGELVQTVPYEKAEKGKSYVRESGLWKWSSIPTPGSANIVPASPAKRGEPAPPKNKGTISDVAGVVKKYEPLNVPDKNPEEFASKQAASIAENANSNFSSKATGFIASLIALLSAIFIFLLKKRLTQIS